MTELNSHHFPLSGQQLIEASAGTGKTYTIANLYLRLLLGRDPNLERPLKASEILVLTFTIAATDELRDRIRKRVSLARQMFCGEVPLEKDPFIAELIEASEDVAIDRRLLTATLQTMDEAAIFTIHSFCARVLGEQSFDTGMLFNQDLDGDREQLLEMAAEDCFRQDIMRLPNQVRGIALKQWPDPARLASFVKRFMFRHNLQHLPPFESVDTELEELLADMQRCKQMWLEEDITALVASAGFHGARLTVKQLDPAHPAYIEDFCRSDDIDITRFEPWTKAVLEKNRTKKTVMPDHEIFDLIDSIWTRQDLFSQFGINLCHIVTEKIRTNMDRYKTQFGQLTLDDLLVEVHKALTIPNLAATLKTRWPVALIDEFQDTDDLQFEIFSRIYMTGGLFFIGDPKQAIYNFRGADVYTYINAKQGADNRFSLGTNWRSTPAMIAAVNHLFDQPEIFGDDDEIPFDTVSAAPPNKDKALTISKQVPPPVSIFLSDATNKDALRENLMAHAAETTVQLLHQAQKGNALINDEPIRPGQIAFLVRQWQDAKAARRALSDRNVRSVYVTLDSVLLADTATDLKMILEAVLDPTNETLLRTALGTRLMQTPASEIVALNEDWSALHEVMEEFQEYHQRWATAEIAPMLELLMSRRKLADKWLKHPDGERQITNLRHLSEILQTRAMIAPGMRRLLKWFRREQQAAERVSTEERQLRLESDQDLVQIVTMHASKGLEYDVVMIPFAGFGEPRNEKHPLFHLPDDQGRYYPAIDFAGSPEHQTLYQAEDFSETMRLLYVAITRARYRCYLGVPLHKNILKTPIAKLLQLTDAPEQSLECLPAELFKVEGIVDPTLTEFSQTDSAQNLAAPKPAPTLISHWRMHSYTGLTRMLEQNDGPSNTESQQNVQPRPGFGDDDSEANSDVADSYSRFTFPRGARVGIVLHDFMEQLDFAAEEHAVQQQAAVSLKKMGVADPDGAWQTVLVEWFKDIVTTPLGEQAPFSLSDVPRDQRLDEMEFHFPVAANQAFLDYLSHAGVLKHALTLNTASIEGMMMGYVDLIFRHKDQFYLVDYKSNDLGPTQADYETSKLAEAMQHHHYDLQYLIYCVALNRYLSKRLPDYRFERDFGGVCYLFLRGMDGSTGAGVFYDKPEAGLISELDTLLGKPS